MAVHLTQLRIAGFKSFADPVELAVLPGLTGIVGPNGCGKSNVADALRWAMGEWVFSCIWGMSLNAAETRRSALRRSCPVGPTRIVYALLPSAWLSRVMQMPSSLTSYG